MLKQSIFAGDRFRSNQCGWVVVVKYESARKVTVEFEDTGGVTTRTAGDIRRGKIIDPKYASAYGVGILDGVSTVDAGGVALRSYSVWYDMLKRCYSPKWLEKYPTYVGCSVCPEWLYFGDFKQWFDAKYIEGYVLDKDIKIEGNKIYSPNTCLFVPVYYNSLQSCMSRMYKVLLSSPSGEEVVVGNQRQFAKSRGLSMGQIHKLARGKLSQHKGWKFIRRLD